MRINMRLPRVLDRRRRRYEELVTRHLDGVLDAAGEGRLQAVLSADPALAAEVRELEAVTAVVRATPMVEAPRSFALPYAPARVPAARRTGALSWMQAATATAALLLVTLIGVDLVFAPSAGPSAGREAPEISAARAEDASAAVPATPTPASLAVQAAPAPDAPLTLEAAPPPPDAPASEDAIGNGATELAGAEAEPDERVVAFVPEPAPAPVTPAPAPGRSGLDWAQLGLGLLTALLAMGVALVSWRATRLSGGRG